MPSCPLAGTNTQSGPASGALEYVISTVALIVSVIFNNRSYQILHNEMRNVGASNIGPKARQLLDLDNPVVDWVSVAKGFGVPGTRVTDLDQLGRALDAGYAGRGPCLIEVML